MKLLLSLLLVTVVSATDREATLRGTVRTPIADGQHCGKPEVAADKYEAVCRNYKEKYKGSAMGCAYEPVGVGNPPVWKLKDDLYQQKKGASIVGRAPGKESVCKRGSLCGKSLTGVLTLTGEKGCGKTRLTALYGLCRADKGTCMPADDANTFAAGGDASKTQHMMTYLHGRDKAAAAAQAPVLHDYTDHVGR